MAADEDRLANRRPQADRPNPEWLVGLDGQIVSQRRGRKRGPDSFETIGCDDDLGGKFGGRISRRALLGVVKALEPTD